MKQLVIFDLDGTLLDTLEDLKSALNYALAKQGLPGRSLEEVRSFVGNGIRKLVERGVPPGTDPALTERVYADFQPYYADHCLDKTRPYPGIPALLIALKNQGVKRAVVSNKADFAVQSLCRHFFSELLDTSQGELPGVPRKPAPDMVLSILDRLSIPRRQALYVGDSEVDLMTAKNAGLDCVSVTWGFRHRSFLERQGALRLADKPEDVLRLIS